MNVEHRVFQKLFKEEKTELATQKVELSLSDDVIKAEQQATKYYEQSIKATLKILTELNSAISDAENAVKLANKMQSKIKELDAMAKDLGVKLPSSVNTAAQKLYDISESGGQQHLKDLIKMKSII